MKLQKFLSVSVLLIFCGSCYSNPYITRFSDIFNKAPNVSPRVAAAVVACGAVGGLAAHAGPLVNKFADRIGADKDITREIIGASAACGVASFALKDPQMRQELWKTAWCLPTLSAVYCFGSSDLAERGLQKIPVVGKSFNYNSESFWGKYHKHICGGALTLGTLAAYYKLNQ